MMRLSISTWFLDAIPGMTTETCLATLKETGFDYIDLNLWTLCRPGTPLAGEGWRDWILQIRAHADQIGVAIRQTHGHTLLGLEWDDPAYPHREFFDIMRLRCIEASRLLGAEWMVVHPFNLPHDPVYSRQKAKDVTLRYLAPMIEEAKKQGVGLAVENMVDFSRNRRRYCGGDPEELLELVDAVHDPAVGICIDTGHANLSGVHAGSFIRMAGNRLKATHINDNYKDADRHLPPTFGTVDWQDVMKALREIGYQNDFSYEICALSVPSTAVDSWCRYIHELGESLLQM